MPGITANGGCWVDRVWFYHGGSDYAYSGVPYEIKFVTRAITDVYGETYHHRQTLLGLETTCNFCWEIIEVGAWMQGNLDENYTLGAFFRPLGGYPGNQTPRIWVDRYVDHERASVTFTYIDPNVYTNPQYFSEYGIGEVIIGMEVHGDVIVPVGASHFSTLKSLY